MSLRATGRSLRASARAFLAALTTVLLCCAASAPAQESLPQHSPPPPKPAVKIQFLPPPMEGTISLGIYNAAGKLVRALHKEAAVDSDAFFKDINGLVTYWDGKDDSGALMPAGKYFARGFMVGDLQIEGEAFHCNDWATEDNIPRIRRVTGIGPFTDTVDLTLELVDGKRAFAQCAVSGSLTLLAAPPPQISERFVAREGKVWISGADGPALELPSLGTAVAVCAGRDDTLWVIARAPDGNTEVKQYSVKGEFLRRLAIDPTQPIPTKIAASTVADAICLLEENAQCQRFRWLELTESASTQTGSAQPTAPTSPSTSAPVSTWKEALRRTITFSDQFAQVKPELKLPAGKPVEGEEKARVPLVPNPLLMDKAGSMELALGFDAGGSFLKTADGLLLKRITDTPLLKWAVMDRDSGGAALVVFQGDGAVVEEYRIGKPGNMMAFDFGEFQFSPGK